MTATQKTSGWRRKRVTWISASNWNEKWPRLQQHQPKDREESVYDRHVVSHLFSKRSSSWTMLTLSCASSPPWFYLYSVIQCSEEIKTKSITKRGDISRILLKRKTQQTMQKTTRNANKWRKCRRKKQMWVLEKQKIFCVLIVHMIARALHWARIVVWNGHRLVWVIATAILLSKRSARRRRRERRTAFNMHRTKRCVCSGATPGDLAKWK